MRLTREQFAELRAMQVKYRMDWPAVFSTGGKNQVWPCPGRGWSRHQQRTYLKGHSQTLDAIVGAYLKVRSEGGRFFLDERGAFFAPEALGVKLPDIQFVKFELLG